MGFGLPNFDAALKSATKAKAKSPPPKTEVQATKGFDTSRAQRQVQKQEVSGARSTLQNIINPPVRPVDDQVHATGKVQKGGASRPAAPRPMSFLDKRVPGKGFEPDPGPQRAYDAQVAVDAIRVLRGMNLKTQLAGAHGLQNLGITSNPTTRMDLSRLEKTAEGVGAIQSGQAKVDTGLTPGKVAGAVLKYNPVTLPFQIASHLPLGIGKDFRKELSGTGKIDNAIGSAANWTAQAVKDTEYTTQSFLHKLHLGASPEEIAARPGASNLMQQVAVNAVKDAVNLPAQALPSVYLPIAAGVEALEGRPQRLKQVEQGAVAMLSPKYWKEHPLNTLLIARGGIEAAAGGLERLGLRAKGGPEAPRTIAGNAKEPATVASRNVLVNAEQRARVGLKNMRPDEAHGTVKALLRRADEEVSAQQYDFRQQRAAQIKAHYKSLQEKVSLRQAGKTIVKPGHTEHGFRKPIFGDRTLPVLAAITGAKTPEQLHVAATRLRDSIKAEMAKRAEAGRPADHPDTRVQRENLAALEQTLTDPRFMDKAGAAIHAGSEFQKDMAPVSKALADRAYFSHQTAEDSPHVRPGRLLYGMDFAGDRVSTPAFERETALKAQLKEAETQHNRVSSGAPRFRTAEQKAADTELAAARVEKTTLDARRAQKISQSRGMNEARAIRGQFDAPLRKNAERIIKARETARAQRRADIERLAGARDTLKRQVHAAKVPADQRTHIPGLIHTPESIAHLEAIMGADHPLPHVGAQALADTKLMMKAEGRGEPAHVSGLIRPDDNPATDFYTRPDTSPQAEASPARVLTGAALIHGLHDYSSDALLRQRVRSTGELSRHYWHSSKHRTFLSGVNGEPDLFRDGNAASAAARDPDYLGSRGYPRDGSIKLRLVRIGPQFAKNVFRQGIVDEIRNEPGNVRDIQHEQLPNDFEEATTGQGPGYYGLVPDDVLKRFDEHAGKATHAGRGFMRLSNFMRNVRYTTSTKHIAGVTSETIIRNITEAAGIRSRSVFKSYMQYIDLHYPELRREIEARVLTGTGSGQAERFNIHNPPKPGSSLYRLSRAGQGARNTAVIGTVPRVWKVYSRASLHATRQLVEVRAQEAMAGRTIINAARQAKGGSGIGLSFKLKSIFDSADAVIAHQDQALTSYLNGLADPHAIIGMGRELDAMGGKFARLTPGEFETIRFSPFMSWYLNSLKWLYIHMPTNHPVKTAIVGLASGSTQDMRDKLGVGDVFAKDGVVGYQEGGIPIGKYILGQQYYSPFGAVSDPVRTAADLAAPPILSDLVRAGTGDNPLTGEVLKNQSGINLSENLDGEIGYILNLAFNDLIPFYTFGEKLAEGGAAPRPESNLLDPQTYKPGSTGEGAWKYVRPYRLNVAKRRPLGTGKGGGFGSLGLPSGSGGLGGGGDLGGSSLGGSSLGGGGIP